MQTKQEEPNCLQTMPTKRPLTDWRLYAAAGAAALAASSAADAAIIYATPAVPPTASLPNAKNATFAIDGVNLQIGMTSGSSVHAAFGKGPVNFLLGTHGASGNSLVHNYRGGSLIDNPGARLATNLDFFRIRSSAGGTGHAGNFTTARSAMPASNFLRTRGMDSAGCAWK
jgi:hypothetical protein